MKLSDLCEIKTNFPDANFWLIRKGSIDAVGKPTKEFSPEHIGIKVIETEVLVPNYLFYLLQFLHMKGIFKELATGALRLQNIKIADIKNLPIETR